MLLDRIAVGISWLPDSLAMAVYVIAALLLIFLFIKIILLILEFIKGIADLIMFWKR